MMKIFQIAMILLCINLVAGFFVACDILPVEIEYATGFDEAYFQSVANESKDYSGGVLDLIYLSGDIMGAVTTTIKLVWQAPTMLSTLMQAAGFPIEIVTIFKTMTYVIYILGFLQIVLRLRVDD